MLKLLISGGTGKLGSEILKHAQNFEVTKALSSKDNLEDFIKNADIVIDVSTAENVQQVFNVCEKHQKPLIIGTTGHSFQPTTSSIPLLIASNFSIGMNVLYQLAEQASSLLGKNFDVHIIDKHHTAKKDAPSGSAKTLLKHTQRGEVLSIRAGSIVGEHQVLFSGPGESIEITHRAENRAIFATGAIQAATWLVKQKPGIYSMQDFLTQQKYLS